MAFLHFAYTFDSVAFHKNLQAVSVIDSKLDLKQLQILAKSQVNNADDELKKILNVINYNEDWLDDPERDASQAYLWYTINLASNFHPSLSLSNNRFHGSHYILEKILPIGGWQKDEVNELILGRSLKELLNNGEFQIFADELSIYGGVISIKKIPLILSHVRDSAQYFASESEISEEILEEYTRYSDLNVAALLDLAYKDAVDMLEAAIKRDEDLYLFRHS